MIGVVANPRCGGLLAGDVGRIVERLGAHDEVRLRVLRPGEDVTALARALADGGCETVVAVGGDGTVSAVAAALIERDELLGIVPRGTSNSVARSLGLPLDLEGACAVITEGIPRRVDTARVADRPMLLMATVGLHERAITTATVAEKQALGVLAYVRGAMAHALADDAFMVELRVDDPTAPPMHLRARALTVANMVPARTVVAQGPDAVRPEDGLLDVTLIDFDSVADAAVTGLHLFQTALAGEPATRDNVAWLRAREVWVDTVPTRPLMVDGERHGQTPFVARCVPASLSVLCPAS